MILTEAWEKRLKAYLQAHKDMEYRGGWGKAKRMAEIQIPPVSPEAARYHMLMLKAWGFIKKNSPPGDAQPTKKALEYFSKKSV